VFNPTQIHTYIQTALIIPLLNFVTRRLSYDPMHSLEMSNVGHSFPWEILPNSAGHREIPQLTAKSSKFRGSPRPPICDWKLFRNISCWRLALY